MPNSMRPAIALAAVIALLAGCKTDETTVPRHPVATPDAAPIVAGQGCAAGCRARQGRDRPHSRGGCTRMIALLLASCALGPVDPEDDTENQVQTP